ncbi:hypothetical protein GCM10009677_37580 [Sphaerisporangium rubeum]
MLTASCTSGGNGPPPSPVTTPPSPSSTAPAYTCEPLDSLTLGKTITIGPPPGSSYQPPLMDIAAHPFTLANNTTTANGHAKTENSGKAGGSGVEIRVNNLTLSISRGFGQVLRRVRFSFGEYGGNINVSANNQLVNVDNFSALHRKTIGGVEATVLSGGLGHDNGVIEFSGTMRDQQNGLGQLAVGGQELWIDDICFEQ